MDSLQSLIIVENNRDFTLKSEVWDRVMQNCNICLDINKCDF